MISAVAIEQDGRRENIHMFVLNENGNEEFLTTCWKLVAKSPGVNITSAGIIETIEPGSRPPVAKRNEVPAIEKEELGNE